MAESGWKRVTKGGWHTVADSREVDATQIEKLLQQRSKAKAKKEYGVADKIAARLQQEGICYVDEKKEWYTRVPPKVSGDKRERSEPEDGAGGGGSPAVSAGKRNAGGEAVAKKVKADADSEPSDEKKKGNPKTPTTTTPATKKKKKKKAGGK